MLTFMVLLLDPLDTFIALQKKKKKKNFFLKYIYYNFFAVWNRKHDRISTDITVKIIA